MLLEGPKSFTLLHPNPVSNSTSIPREEATPITRTFDLVRNIRARRLERVGHILRMEWGRLVHKAVCWIYNNRKEGDLLMDVPASADWWHLVYLAGDREY